MPTFKATIAGRTIAESADTILVEGNQYFPPASVDRSVLGPSDLHTHCPWKGEASYYNINLESKSSEWGKAYHSIVGELANRVRWVTETELKNAAWYYPDTSGKAKHIEGYIAFYKDVVDVKSD